MIKDKISPEIKDEFRELIRVSGILEKEIGVLLCRDEKGNLTTTKDVCVGDKCILRYAKKLKCPVGTKSQGEFHTHPYIANIKEALRKEYPKEQLTDKFIRTVISKEIKEKKFLVTSPSHADILAALIRKYDGDSLGTTCVGNDIKKDIVECWTAIKNITKRDYLRAVSEVGKHVTGQYPQKWTKPLFDIETINIKKKNK